VQQAPRRRTGLGHRRTSPLCTAAYTSAQHGSRHQALDLITEAEAAARMGGARLQRTQFSSTNAVYRIGIHTALGDPGTALDYARKIDLRSLRTLIGSLLDAPGPMPAGLREFAARCGAAA
jgi:hypothetical protein